VALIAQEPGILVSGSHAIGDEVQAVVHVLPIGNETGHVLVDGDVGIRVHRTPYVGKIPSAVVIRVPEVRQIERSRRGHDKEIADPGPVIDIPVGGTREEQAVVTIRPRIVILAGRAGVQHPGCAVGVDLKDRHVRVGVGPVVDANPIARLEHRIDSTIQPDPRLTSLLNLDVGDERVQAISTAGWLHYIGPQAYIGTQDRREYAHHGD
jgi:hypothetical protein